MTEATQPTNVIQALAAVMRDIPGIAKDTDSTQGYRYRGIEAVTREAQPLFAKYGVVFVPRVLTRNVKDYLANGKPWTEDCLLVEYDVYGPGGPDDKITVGPLVGLGRDNSDKGANKAMTQAFKYALLQTLTIADAKDDGDQHTSESDTPRPERTPAEQARLDFAARVRNADKDVRRRFIAWNTEQGYPEDATRLADDQWKVVSEWFDNAEDAAAQDAATAVGDAAETSAVPSQEPESAPKPDADPNPAAEPSRGLQAEPADRYSQACAAVNGMDLVDVLSDLAAYELTPERTQAKQRLQLAEALAADPAWTAPVQGALV